MARDTYKYHFKIGNDIIHTGFTNDLSDKEKVLQRTLDERGRIVKVGRAITKDAALKWEAEQAERGMPTRRNKGTNVIKLIDVTEQTKHWGPADLLEYYARLIRDDGLPIRPNKAMVIFLDDTDNKYEVRYCSAQQKLSECIAVMEVAKTIMMKKMGHIPSE